MRVASMIIARSASVRKPSFTSRLMRYSLISSFIIFLFTGFQKNGYLKHQRNKQEQSHQARHHESIAFFHFSLFSAVRSFDPCRGYIAGCCRNVYG